jgi:hypothetical protein
MPCVMDDDDSDALSPEVQQPGQDFLPFIGLIFTDTGKEAPEVIQHEYLNALVDAAMGDNFLVALSGKIHHDPFEMEKQFVIQNP